MGLQQAHSICMSACIARNTQKTTNEESIEISPFRA